VTTRNLRTSALSSREELADALQALFVAELLAASSPLWIVTPWISDVAVIDNRSGLFSGLLPDMPRRPLRLTEVLIHQLQRGGGVSVVCRPDQRNRLFVEQLAIQTANTGLSERLAYRYGAELHEKGILTDNLLLSGSMNLTYNGLRRLEESILITDDPDAVARARHAYEDRWGPA
jgi:phosphatidylserine/phosphatidylglycerophosphate/cardiolipin synthase-like enzyme